MWKRFLGELPSWARTSNPLLAYEIGRHAPDESIRARVGRVVFSVLVLVALLVGGYLYATDGLQQTPEAPYTLVIWRVLFFPLLILQVLLRAAALVLGAGAVDEERRRQTWDPLRATENGAAIALKSRWFSILGYRLRPLLIAIWAGRVLLLGALLVEVASLQGALLEILALRSQPSLGIVASIGILAAQMTAFFLLPFTAAGVDAALGLAISSSVRNRAFASVILILAVLIRVGSTLLLFIIFAQFMDGLLELNGAQAWLVQVANAIFGDWGLASAQITQTGQLWAQVPGSIFLGLLMLVAVLLQSLLTEGLLRLAAGAAERQG